VKLDVPFLGLFGALLACLQSNFFGLAPQYFTANFGIFIWPGYCGLLFLLYVQFQDRALRVSPLRYVGFFGRVLLIFLVSVAAAVALDYCLRPQDRGEWQLGAFFLFAPAAIAGVVGFAIGWVVRLLRSRVT
jgi:hypothetical protein